MHVPNGNVEKKGCCCDTKAPVGKTLRFFHSEKVKKSIEGRRSNLRKNAVGKKQQWAQYAIYKGTAPRKAKRPTTPSLKRHAAWEYPESAAHHKSLFGSRTPTRNVAQPDKKSTSVSKNQLFFNPPFFSGKIGKLKRGAL